MYNGVRLSPLGLFYVLSCYSRILYSTLWKHPVPFSVCARVKELKRPVCTSFSTFLYSELPSPSDGGRAIMLIGEATYLFQQ